VPRRLDHSGEDLPAASSAVFVFEVSGTAAGVYADGRGERTWVEEQVKRRGYGTASEFVRHVLRREQQRERRGEIDQNLLEALDSGELTPMTKKDWDDIRREGRRRLAKRTKKAR